jgi:hypothetical protein
MNDGQAYDEQGLPWLEAVDDEDGPRGVSARKMLAALLFVLLAIGIVAATLFWIGRRDAALNSGGAPELIRAEPGPYKVKPDDPGGLDVAGDSGTAFATGAGEDRDAEIDLGAVAEEPILRPKPEPAPPPKTLPGNEAKEPVAPEAPAPLQSAGGAGSTVQLGFYDNPAQAEKAWTSLSTRFSTVGAMTKVVVPYQKGFRLRANAASPAEARQACQILKVAGENCFVAR